MGKKFEKKALGKSAKWLAGAVVAPLVVSLLGWGIIHFLSSSSSEPSRTEVKILRPGSVSWVESEDGDRFQVAFESQGYCAVASETDGSPDALRCYTHDLGPLDPCFSDGKEDALCTKEPWSDEVARVAVSQLPPAQPVESEEALKRQRPWALELANGKRCLAVDGATGDIAGIRVDYLCGTGEEGVVGSPDDSRQPWIASYVSGRTKETSDVSVAVAWF